MSCHFQNTKVLFAQLQIFIFFLKYTEMDKDCEAGGTEESQYNEYLRQRGLLPYIEIIHYSEWW